MPNNNLTLGIDAKVSGTSEIDRLDAALARAGATADRTGKATSGALQQFHQTAQDVGKATEAVLALTGAHAAYTLAVERYAAAAIPATSATDALVNGFRALRFAISPTLFTAASIGVGLLVEETLRLVNARGKLIEQQSLLAATSGNSFGDIERIGGAAGISGGNSGDLTAALSKLRENIASSQAQSALRSIGVPSYAGTAATPELLAEIAKGFSSIEDPVKRAQAAVDLFGAELGAKVLPQLNQRFVESSKAVTDWGLTLSEADRTNIYVFKRDVQNLKDDVLSLGVGFQASWQKMSQSVAVEGAEIYSNIRKLAGQISDFQAEAGRKNGEVPYVSLLLQGGGTGDLDKAARFAQSKSQAAGDAAAQRDAALGLRDEARGMLARIDASREGVERQISIQRGIQSKAADIIRQNSGSGPLAGQLSSDVARNAAAQLIGATREETALKASLKIIEEQEKVAAKIEAHYIAILEQAQALRLNGEPFLNVGSGLLQTLVTSQDQADSAYFRKAPSLLRSGEYNPNTAQDGTTDLEGGSIAGGRFVSPSADRRADGFNGTGTAGLFDDPKYKQAEQIHLDGLRNELDYTSQIIALRAGPGGELSAALKINSLRLDAAYKEFETTNDIVTLENTRTKLAQDRSVLAEQEVTRQRDQIRSFGTGLFDSLFGGPHGIENFVLGQLKSVGGKIAGNAAGLEFEAIRKVIPKTSDPNSTIGKLLAGTPFGADPLKGATDLNTAATVANTQALTALVTGAGSPSGGGGSIGSASTLAKILGGVGSTAGLSLSTDAGSGEGPEYNGAPPGQNIGGEFGGSKFGARAAGIAVAAGGGFAAFKDFKSGGVKNDIAGAGALLGSAAAITALIPGGQIVALGLGIASAATSLVAGLLPDPKKVREAAITKELEQNKYIAPTALNISQDGSGNYTDFDGRGNLRTSPFRAVPSVNQAYTWYKGNTPYDVPGGVTSPFQQTPQVITVNIHAIDTQSGADFLRKNPDAIGEAFADHLQNTEGRAHQAIRYAAN